MAWSLFRIFGHCIKSGLDNPWTALYHIICVLNMCLRCWTLW